MRLLTLLSFVVLVVETKTPPLPVEVSTAESVKKKLEPFQVLIDEWKASGTVEGTIEQKQAGLWSEKHQWEWNFATPEQPKIKWTIKDGKHFRGGELTYRTDKQDYLLSMETVKQEKQLFTGLLTVGKQKEQILTVECATDEQTIQKLTFTLLHANRIMIRSDTRSKTGKLYTKQYQLGCTKEGEPFAQIPKGNECIVSGGKGSIPVTYKGTTYYVCCSGCKDAFNDDPEKWINLAKKP